MREKIIHIIQAIGTGMSTVFRYLPLSIKKIIVSAVRTLIALTPGKLSSSTYLFGYELVKYMFIGTKVPVFLSKTFFNDIKINLDVTKKTQRILYLQKVYEPYVLNYLLKNLKKGDMFMDIGANVGIYTLIAAKLVGKNGFVISFEPEKTNYASLKNNIQENNFSNVSCINKAVSSQNGTMTLNINPLNEGGASLNKLNQYHDDDEVFTKEEIEQKFPETILEQKTEVVSVDSFLKTNNKIPSIIKIDIEGAELGALEGSTELLEKNYAPDIIIEVGVGGENIIDFLEGRNYSLYTLDKNGNAIPYKKTGHDKVKALLASKRQK